MDITKFQLHEIILIKRMKDFINNGSEEAQDFFKIALSYSKAKILNDSKKYLNKKLTEEEAYITDFINLQEKYGFDYLAEITEEEKKNMKDVFFQEGIFVVDNFR